MARGTLPAAILAVSFLLFPFHASPENVPPGNEEAAGPTAPGPEVPEPAPPAPEPAPPVPEAAPPVPEAAPPAEASPPEPEARPDRPPSEAVPAPPEAEPPIAEEAPPAAPAEAAPPEAAPAEEEKPPARKPEEGRKEKKSREVRPREKIQKEVPKSRIIEQKRVPRNRIIQEIVEEPRPAAPPVEEKPPAEAEPEPELELARDAREADRRLLATVHWALGVLAAIALLLNAFGWLAHIRTSKRDRAALRERMLRFLEGRLARMRDDLRADVAARHESLVGDLRAAGSETAAEVRRLAGDLRAAGSEAAAEVRREIAPRLDRLDRDVGAILYEMHERDVRLWETRGVKANALAPCAAMLRVALERGSEEMVTRALDRMTGLLRRIAQGMKEIQPDAERLREVDVLLDTVPPEHAKTASNLKGLLATIRSR